MLTYHRDDTLWRTLATLSGMPELREAVVVWNDQHRAIPITLWRKMSSLPLSIKWVVF